MSRMRRRKSWKDQMMRSLMVDEEGGEFDVEILSILKTRLNR